MDKNGSLQVGLIKLDEPYYFFTTKILGNEEYRINQDEIRKKRQEQDDIANAENRPQAERQQPRERVDGLYEEIYDIEKRLKRFSNNMA